MYDGPSLYIYINVHTQTNTYRQTHMQNNKIKLRKNRYVTVNRLRFKVQYIVTCSTLYNHYYINIRIFIHTCIIYWHGHPYIQSTRILCDGKIAKTQHIYTNIVIYTMVSTVSHMHADLNYGMHCIAYHLHTHYE